jgi:hypothetical protein
VSAKSSLTEETSGIYITKSKGGEISDIKFVLSPSAASASKQPFIHSEGGSMETPITIRSSEFTITSGSLGSLSYNIIEIVDGATLIVGCTFSDLKMNPAVANTNGVIVVKNAGITLRNSIFTNISLETNAAVLGDGGGRSECEWGSYSVIELDEAVTSIKDVVMSNTYAGIRVHGGTAVVEGSNFTEVGKQGKLNYPSVERHLRCGLFIYLCICL